MSAEDIQSYIRLCRFLGGYKDLVQGSGGNISVKSENKLCIKSSGRLLAETSIDYGYVICDKYTLESLYAIKSEDTKQTVLQGEPNGSPSMEVFFHLLPSKWVVHLHPTWLLKYLCQESWSTLTLDDSIAYTFVPYVTPGVALADAVHALPKGFDVYFLQNHGLILCAETVPDILRLLDIVHQHCLKLSTQTLQVPEYSTMYTFQKKVSELTKSELVLRPCSIMNGLHDRLFLPITPDISLFLKQMPLAQESSCESLESHLETYWKQFDTYPAVIKRLNRVYVLGKSVSHCICIEELLAQYLEITRTVDPNTLTMFSTDVLFSLKSSEKEIQRLNIV
jgi:rhamnose utilization protein RhaD (predicted bifunctional aldolase and dehydrogenase)